MSLKPDPRWARTPVHDRPRPAAHGGPAREVRLIGGTLKRSKLPVADKPGGYTWNKAPRLAGQVVECGAIARQLADGQPLVRATVARLGATVYTRVLARLIELARLVPLMEDWLQQIRPREPFFDNAPLPDDGEGCGLTEAARGALGHWVRLERGRIAQYQIIAPTSWNFSPRDAAGTPATARRRSPGRWPR